MDLVVEIYKTTKEFPNQEIYGITNQVRRAAVSVPSNIAEGTANEERIRKFSSRCPRIPK